MARQIERGKAPWQLPRAPREPQPENFASRPGPHRGQNSVWLQAAADHRGYSDPHLGTAASIEQAGGRVRPEETPGASRSWSGASTGRPTTPASLPSRRITPSNAKASAQGIPPPSRTGASNRPATARTRTSATPIASWTTSPAGCASASSPSTPGPSRRHRTRARAKRAASAAPLSAPTRGRAAGPCFANPRGGSRSSCPERR